MQVEGYRSRIFRSSSWVRRNQDRGGENERSVILTNPKESQEHTEVFRTS